MKDNRKIEESKQKKVCCAGKMHLKIPNILLQQISLKLNQITSKKNQRKKVNKKMNIYIDYHHKPFMASQQVAIFRVNSILGMNYL